MDPEAGEVRGRGGRWVGKGSTSAEGAAAGGPEVGAATSGDKGIAAASAGPI